MACLGFSALTQLKSASPADSTLFGLRTRTDPPGHLVISTVTTSGAPSPGSPLPLGRKFPPSSPPSTHREGGSALGRGPHPSSCRAWAGNRLAFPLQLSQESSTYLFASAGKNSSCSKGLPTKALLLLGVSCTLHCVHSILLCAPPSWVPLPGFSLPGMAGPAAVSPSTPMPRLAWRVGITSICSWSFGGQYKAPAPLREEK